jgi:ribonuclease E
MSNKMLIDATHPEETRVVVLRGNRVEEFDFEAADRQQLRGNIYLAKVTRVEPSLQAAFVDYGGNRHGFLAFSEIHPDYYQIPYADRQALLQEHAREDAEQAEREDQQERVAESRAADVQGESEEPASEEPLEESAASFEEGAADEEDGTADEEDGTADPQSSETTIAAEVVPSESVSEPAVEFDETPVQASTPADETSAAEVREDEPGENGDAEREDDDKVESVGAEDALEEVPERRKPRPRQYKIQEVIKRRQVMLVQVVKEERGSKGAALTTFLSLAGRYSVLMPNTARGGGISRKITQPVDRKRLKSIASELDVPEGMGVILRTAGANRTKSEIKRDFEYLLRLWENVRELTLRSTAPKLVYEEGSLIKRSIRDLYSREIDQVVVAGDNAYREAKDFMRMLMPSHARNVQLYKDPTPLFSRNSVEAQLDAMFSPQVTLKSGGYIVINQTEALVSIDVNSGRSTREHSIEDTALKTNLEASEEISRQLRLRDLAGLIVIDFIDMEEKRNNRAVERKLKDCLRADRARIQVGRVSHFGLLEMSRQRIRTGVLESSTVHCPHCRGTGQVRSVSSLSLQILRALEEQLLKHSTHHLLVRTRPEVAVYVLNQKRRHLSELEDRFGVSISVSGEAPESGAGFVVERGAVVEDRPERSGAVAMTDMPEPEEPAVVDEEETEAEAEPSGEGRERRRRRRRKRGNGEDRVHAGEATRAEDDSEAEERDEPEEAEPTADASDSSEQGSRKRRRGRRGGRRRGRGRENGEPGDSERPGDAVMAGVEDGEPTDAAIGDRWEDTAEAGASSTQTAAGVPTEDTGVMQESSERYGGNGGHDEVTAATGAGTYSTGEPETAQSEEASPASHAEAEEQADEQSAPEESPVPQPVEDDRPKRSGWWNRRTSFF